ncbi:ABC transporter permease [Prauserella cavernicola]|uniref:ABC transporter permease n=1 Tax=Prauserella cavernicola TaxID=2800127 RepID=A0A934QXV7_9PSEU|nr:ABC transporter permease [Prauserella cavernicola]MBK1787283.1 ABC transporter permease [Prauserella cavernicola]
MSEQVNPVLLRTGGPRLGVAVPVCAVLAAVIAVAAVAGRWLAPHDPGVQDLLNASTGPSATHWLGTDDFGRDVLSRVLDGAGSSLLGPVVAALGATLLGLLLGLMAGFLGGAFEAVIMRGVDLLYALPALLVLIVLVGMFGGGYWAAVGILIVLSTPGSTRIIRSAVLGQRTLPYVEAAHTVGLPRHRIMIVHVAPNVLPTVVATLLLDFVAALVALSALSFLGLGLPPGSTNWGRMLAENRTLLELNPWAAIAPALLIMIAAMSVTIIGDWLHGRLERGRLDHD